MKLVGQTVMGLQRARVRVLEGSLSVGRSKGY